MLSKVIVLFSLLLTLSAPLANAYTLIKTEKVKGTVQSVDVHAREVVIVDKSGNTRSLNLGSKAVVVLDQVRSADLNKLQPGHTIVFKKQIETPISETIEGHIVSIDHQSLTARIRPEHSNKTIKVRFDDSVNVTSEGNTSLSFKELRKGHTVVVRYTEN